MTLKIRQATRFRRDVKRLRRQHADLPKLQTIIRTLADEKSLNERYRDHQLVGDWRGFRECHIQPDWLLIYRVADKELQLARTGSHAELFGK